MKTDLQVRWEEPGDRHAVWSAILFADMVGYSRMMSHDELSVVEFMVGCSRMIEDVSRRYGGLLVQTTGDGFLLLFETCNGAVSFGSDLHRLVAKRQTNLSEPALFRVGIHAGDVYRSGGMYHGHAVNIAARLEAEADSGTCVLSQEVHDAVAEPAQHDWVIEAIGAPPLKNIAERIQLYRLQSVGSQEKAASTKLPVLTMIGDVALASPDAEEIFAPDEKATALLGYLALSVGHRERNDKIASLIWPHLSSEDSRKAFAECRGGLIDRLRGRYPNLIDATDNHTGLNETHFVLQTDKILEDLRRGRVRDQLHEDANWPNRILDGVETDNPVFSAWLKVCRTTLYDRVASALTGILKRSPPEDDASRDAAKAILIVEPGNELASAALIRHLRTVGNRAAALAEYQRICGYLADKFQLPPSAELQTARDEISFQNTAGQTRPVVRPQRFSRLVVEQFRASDVVDQHLVDGFRTELVSNLARFREWSVVEDIDRSPTSRKDPAATSVYSVEGVFNNSGAFSLYLRDIEEGRLIWSGEFSLDPANWNARQRDVIGRIAAHLDTYISADRLSSAVGGVEHRTTSHDRWLYAESTFARWTPQAARQAEDILRQVIADDPSFAPAYSSLASFYNVRHVIRPGIARDEINAREAHALAEQAVELDPLDARNQLALAWTAALTGAFERASIHLDMAANLNPNGQSTLVSCAMANAFIGRAERALALIDHVQRISLMLSDYQWCYVSSVYFLAGRYEEALKASIRSGDRIVDNQGWIAATYVQLGRTEEASAAFEQLIERVRPVWAGESPPTAEAIFEWFVNAYPLRNASDRARLSDSLGAALRGQ